MRVLVIEDEVRLARNIRRGLQSDPSFVVDLAHDGVEGAHLAATEAFDLVVLDLLLPGCDGLEVLRRIRAAGKATPVLILTARAAPGDVVRGLGLGSDDYLAKPFDMGVLLARAKALVRRSRARPDPRLRVGDLEIDTLSHLVHRGGRTVRLPALEYRLLEYLAFRAGEVVSQEEILEHLYGTGGEKFSNVVEHYVSGIRAKIDRDAPVRLLRTVRGQGYVLGGAAP